MVTTQQEKLLGEKDVVVERQKHELHTLNEALTQKQEDVSRYSHTFTSDSKYWVILPFSLIPRPVSDFSNGPGNEASLPFT